MKNHMGQVFIFIFYFSVMYVGHDAGGSGTESSGMHVIKDWINDAKPKPSDINICKILFD